MKQNLADYELRVFCYVDSCYETIQQIHCPNTSDTEIFFQRFHSQSGERVLWVHYGPKDNPVFDSFHEKLVKAGKWKGLEA